MLYDTAIFKIQKIQLSYILTYNQNLMRTSLALMVTINPVIRETRSDCSLCRRVACWWLRTAPPS